MHSFIASYSNRYSVFEEGIIKTLTVPLGQDLLLPLSKPIKVQGRFVRWAKWADVQVLLILGAPTA
jgi:hypothetical protein